MPEPATPQAGVAQEAPSDLERVTQFLSQSEDQEREKKDPQAPENPNPPQGNAEQPQGQAEELTLEDLDEGQPQTPAVDAFELAIVHNGQEVKLSRADSIKYAQQGLDATRKWEAAAQKDRKASQWLQQLQEVDQVRPYLQEQEGVLASLGAQLRQYQNVDWVAVANEDPVGYAPKRAQYDVLVQNYQQVLGQYNQTAGAVRQRLDAVRGQQLAQEASLLPAYVPEWKDPAKLKAGQQAIVKWLEGYGIRPEVANRKLDDAFSIAVAYKAMRYDQLLKAKGEKTKQLRTAPPVTVPGAKTTSGKADKDRDLTAKLRKSGSLDDAAALLLNRM